MLLEQITRRTIISSTFQLMTRFCREVQLEVNASFMADFLSVFTLSSHVTILPFLFVLANAAFFHLDAKVDLFVALPCWSRSRLA